MCRICDCVKVGKESCVDATRCLPNKLAPLTRVQLIRAKDDLCCFGLDNNYGSIYGGATGR